MARQTRATSRSSGGKERKVIRSTGGEEELSAVSSKSKKIKKPQAFARDGILLMRAQLSRMETRIEAVEEELRLEKQKNAALLQHSHLSPSLNPQSCQDSVATTVSQTSSCNGKKAKTAPLGGSGDGFNPKRHLKMGSSQGGLERKRSSGEDGVGQSVTPVKRRRQQEESGGGVGRTNGEWNTPTSSRPGGVFSSPKKPGCAVGSPARSRCGRSNPGRLRSAAVAASAAVASVVAGGRRRARRRNCIVSDLPFQAAPVVARAPPNSPNGFEENSTAPRQAHGTYLRSNEEEKHVCTLRCPASCQGHLRPTEIVVYEGFSTGFELISGNLGVPSTPPPRLQVVKGSIALDLKQEVLEEAPSRVRMLLNQPKVSREQALEHGWNPADCSFNLNLKFGDPFTVKRRPVAQSTDCVRGKKSYSRGVHAWGFRWPKGERGTHAVVGVANNEQVLHCVGYRSLVGSGVHSWGWDLGRASAYHGGEGRPYPRPNFSVPDTFTMVLDLEAGSLAFKVDNIYLGPAFSGLKGPLYPVISTVWGNSEVSLVYRGSLEPEPLSLQQLAREEINQALDGRSLEDLGLPTRLRRFLLYQA